jgi:hypothetical protein
MPYMEEIPKQGTNGYFSSEKVHINTMPRKRI